MPFAEDHTVKRYLANINFDRALPRASDEKNNDTEVLAEGMAAKMAEEEAKRESDEILRPKVDMDKSYAAQGFIRKVNGGVGFSLQHARVTGKKEH